MSSNFTNAMDGKHGPIKRTPRVTLTENGALTNASTFNAVLDFYSKSGALRGRVGEFANLFISAYQEDRLLAIRALFQARDIRGGNGERTNFRWALAWLHTHQTPYFHAIIKWVPHFGRWDDLMDLIGDEFVADFLARQLHADLRDMDLGKPVSLLAKWMPSENASSRKTRTQAIQLANYMQMSMREYRKALSALRRHIDIVERKMSAGQWEDIQYDHVPSQAMKIHGRKGKAFLKHDGERFVEYLQSVKRGEKKINAATLTPVQLVTQAWLYHDDTVETLWNNLPNFMKDSSMLVVADTSGSMMGEPFFTAVSLALYAAERNHGPFHNRWLNFSTHPSWQMVQGRTLHQKLYNMDRQNWNGSTDIEAVFRMILTTGVQNNLAQDDMPKIVAIISDMQFNPSSGGRFFTNFDTIKAMYRNAGYEAPAIVWWNVRASHGQPVTKNDRGCIMVSGQSASAFRGLMECDINKLLGITPYDYMLDQLKGERYGVITL